MEDSEIRNDGFAFIDIDLSRSHAAWLVYRGLVSSSDVALTTPSGDVVTRPSFFFAQMITQGVESTLVREAKLEACRLRNFPNKPSRLSAVYAFPSLSDARKGRNFLGRKPQGDLVEIRPKEQGFRAETYDMGWITNFDSWGDHAAEKYWSGEQFPINDDSCQEALLNGQFLILGTEIRKKAYQLIKTESPEALYLLELSRLAVIFGSPLGEVSPMFLSENGEIFLHQVIRYDANESLAVQKRTAEALREDPSFPINVSDLGTVDDKIFRLPNVMAVGPIRKQKVGLFYKTLMATLSE